jgi:hypothetical protein
MSQRQTPSQPNSVVATSSKQKMMQQVLFPVWKTSMDGNEAARGDSEYSLSFEPDDYGKLKQEEYKTSEENNYINQNTNIHNGQVKLLLSEVMFLTRELTPHRDFAFCVYVGAAPGAGTSHLIELLKNFPNTKWFLCDPNFQTRDDANFRELCDEGRCVLFKECFRDVHVEWINRYLRSDVSGDDSEDDYLNFAKLLDNLNLKTMNCVPNQNMLFISDIRANADSEAAIKEDMTNQQNWFERLNAKAGLFKFRPPYPTKGKESSTSYLNGEIFRPVYGCAQTTECRLYVQNKARNIIYNDKTHQNVMYFFNTYWRPGFDDWAWDQIFANFKTRFNTPWKPGFFSTDKPTREKSSQPTPGRARGSRGTTPNGNQSSSAGRSRMVGRGQGNGRR